MRDLAGTWGGAPEASHQQGARFGLPAPVCNLIQTLHISEQEENQTNEACDTKAA